MAVLSPIFYIAWLVKRGLVTDLDVHLREQRTKPMLVATGCAGAGWLMLKLGSAPLQIVILASALLIQSAIMFFITISLRWKISMHSAAAAGAATLVWAITGTPLALMVSVPLVVWSRVRLRRHTLAQTLAGAALGSSVFLVTLWLMQR
jgi:membrane-associated phospholipid phosphatase